LTVLISSVILLSSSFIFAASPVTINEKAQICYEVNDAKNMIVELEKGRITNELLEATKNESAKKTEVITDLKDKIIQCDDKLKLSAGTITDQTNLLNEAEKICDERVVQAKPTLQSEILKVLGGIVVGIVIALLL
jgi:hypothetical protein